MARSKSPAIVVPQSTQEALGLADRFAQVSAEFDVHTANAAAAIAATKAAAATVMLPLVTELKAIEKQLKPWFAVRHEELTGGKRRSIELGGCTIGYRLTPPKVAYAGGTDDDAVATLQTADFGALLRTSVSLDKQAILKLLGDGAEGAGDDDRVERLTALGFSAKQTDEFFIEPIAPAPAVAA